MLLPSSSFIRSIVRMNFFSSLAPDRLRMQDALSPPLHRPRIPQNHNRVFHPGRLPGPVTTASNRDSILSVVMTLRVRYVRPLAVCMKVVRSYCKSVQL